MKPFLSRSACGVLLRCWKLLASFLPILGLLPAQLTAIRRCCQSSCPACWVVSFLDFWLSFGFGGLSSPITIQQVPLRLLSSHLKPSIWLVSGPTCMSHFERLATALSNLAEAIRGVAEELGRARESPPPIASEPLLPGDWELIEDQSSVPGEPSDYNATLRIAVEDGPPPTPEFCLSLARLKLRSARRNPEERAREAFVAGFWFRVSLLVSCAWPSEYSPLLPPSTWLVRSGTGISDFARTNSRREAERFCEDQEGASIVEKFPSVTELQIFCAGAQLPVPPLVQWKRRN